MCVKCVCVYNIYTVCVCMYLYTLYIYIIELNRSMLTYILQTYVVIQITSTFWCGPCSLLELQAWLAPLKIIGTWTRDVAVFKNSAEIHIVSSCTEWNCHSNIRSGSFLFLLLTFEIIPAETFDTFDTFGPRKMRKRNLWDVRTWILCICDWAGGASKTESASSHWFCHLCGLWGVRRFFQTR